MEPGSGAPPSPGDARRVRGRDVRDRVDVQRRPQGFIPETDNDALNIQLRAAQGTYYEMVNYVQQVADLVKRNPYVDAMMANTGGIGGTQNVARFNIQLT